MNALQDPRFGQQQQLRGKAAAMQRSASTAAASSMRPVLGEIMNTMAQPQQQRQPPSPGVGMRKAQTAQQRDKAKVSEICLPIRKTIHQ